MAIKVLLILAPFILFSAFIIKTYTFDKKPVLPDNICMKYFNGNANRCLPGCIYTEGSNFKIPYEPGGPIPLIANRSSSCTGW